MVGVGKCSASGCSNRTHKRYCKSCKYKSETELEAGSEGSDGGLVERVRGMV